MPFAPNKGMLKHVLIQSLLILAPILVIAQTAPSSSSTSVFEQARALVEDFNRLDSAEDNYNQRRYDLVRTHVGEMQIINEKGTRNKFALQPQSRMQFERYASQFAKPTFFPLSQQRSIRQASAITKQLQQFIVSPEAAEIHLKQIHSQEPFRVWKSTKAGVYHVGPELARFATALALIRISTCFGGNVLAMKGPAFWEASDKDPACLEEIGKMLADPIFYMGFSAFIVASRAGTAVLNKTLSKLNPNYGLKQGWTKTILIPQLSLAIGFMADHAFQTLVRNEHIKACIADTFSKAPAASRESETPAFPVTAESIKNPILISPQLMQALFNSQPGETVDVSKSLSANCQNARRVLKSRQFLQEEIGMGIAGLASTALIMSGAQGVLGMTKAGRALQGATMAFSTTGVGGVAVGVGRLLVFLGLFEVLNHHVFSPFYLHGILEPQTDRLQQRLEAVQGEGAEPNYIEVKTGFCAQDFSQPRDGETAENFAKRKKIRASSCPIAYESELTSELTDDAVARLQTADLKLNNAEVCSTHHGGIRGQTNAGALCTRIPMLAELESISEYGRLWREKKVLKEFHLTHSRWRLKLKSFLDNYFASQEQVSQLSMSRELHLSGKSELLEDIKARKESEIDQLLRGILPDSSAIEGMKKNLRESAYRYGRNNQEVPEVLQRLQSGELSTVDPEYQVFEKYLYFYDLDYELEVNRDGDIYYGINGKENVPRPGETVQLLHKILRFISVGDIQVEHPKNRGVEFYDSMLADDFRGFELLAGLELNPFQLQLIERLITSKDSNQVGRGLMIWKEMSPHMYGSLPRRNNCDSVLDGDSDNAPQRGRMSCNPRGMTNDQFALYKKINNALEFFNPLFAKDTIHERGLRGTYYDMIEENRQSFAANGKGPESTQLSNRHMGVKTATMGEYALANLICGMSDTEGLFNRWWGDKDGFALEFEFPHLRDDNVCLKLFFPVYATDYSGPSATKSLFVAPDEDIYYGLQNAYIQAPADYDHPLMFSTQRQAESWWNSYMLPRAIDRLKAMRQRYDELLVQDLFKSTVGSGGGHHGSWFSQQVTKWSRMMPWASGSEEAQAPGMISVDGLSESLLNEMSLYTRASERFLDEEATESLRSLKPSLQACIVNLLNSIPEKNYMVSEESCKSYIDQVKQVYRTDGLSGEAEMQLREMNDEIVARSENPEELIRLRLRFAFGEKIVNLFSEIESLNQLIHESFNFEMLEGEKQ